MSRYRELNPRDPYREITDAEMMAREIELLSSRLRGFRIAPTDPGFERLRYACREFADLIGRSIYLFDADPANPPAPLPGLPGVREEDRLPRIPAGSGGGDA